MPQEKIIIKFEPKGHDRLIAAINKLNTSTKRLTSATDTTTAATGKASTATGILDTRGKRLAQTNGLLANSFATLRSKLLLFSFAMAMGGRQMLQLIGEAAKIESMGRAFDTLSGGGENASIAMDKLQKATNGTMNQFDLFQQANNAMILGVSKNSDEMAEMFDIAQRLGRALGRDTKLSVESLITGIGRQSRLMLDNIGIIVKAEEAYQSYADELGVTVDALTDTDRKQAFLTATMESARQKVVLLGDEILGLQDNLDKLDTATDDAGTAFGEYISKAFAASTISGFLASIFEDFGRFFEFQSLMIDRTAEWNDEIENGIGQTEELASVIAQWNKEQESIGETLGDSIPNLSFVNELYAKSKEVQLELVEARIAVLESFIAMHGATNEEAIALQILIDLHDKLTGKGKKEAEAKKEQQKEQDKLNGLLEKEKDIRLSVLESAIKYGIESKNAGQSAEAAARGVIEKWIQKSVAVQFEKALEFIPLPPPFNLAVAAAMAAGVSGAASSLLSEVKFEQGGLIGGRRHSQGGTMIEAEAGEFVMSRSAVQSVGIENLNRMNEGGGGSAVTVNVSGNVLSQDFVEGELAENIKEAIRRGTDFGIS